MKISVRTYLDLDVSAEFSSAVVQRGARLSAAGAGGMKLMARSAKAVIVRLGLTPRFAATTEASQMPARLPPNPEPITIKS